MECGGSSNQQQNYIIRAPRSGVSVQEPTKNTSIEADDNLSNLPQQSFNRDKDQYMPLANVSRIMRRVLPPHAKIADDAKETMQECVSEFISFITTEANQRCHQEYRKTIRPEDIISAMGTLGFDDYIEPLTFFLNKHRSHNPNRNPMRQPTFDMRNMQPEAQLAQPPSTTGHPSALHGASTVGSNNYFGLPEIRDNDMSNQGSGEGCGQGSSDNFKFDPCSPFK